MNRMTRLMLVAGLTLTGLALSGCGDDKTEPTTKPSKEFGPTTRADAKPGGAPTFGTATGTGFSTGDAAHTGTGSGWAGYNGTGSSGTYGAISDMHDVKDPVTQPSQPVIPPER